MTCIIAYSDGNTAYMGGDRFLGNDWDYTLCSESKVRRIAVPGTKGMLIGFAGNARVGQVLSNLWAPPPYQNQPPMGYLAGPLINSVREVLDDYGVLKKDGNVDNPDTSFLVAFLGQIYSVYSDLQISGRIDNWACMGAGQYAASGAMYAYVNDCMSKSKGKGMAPKTAIRKALEASERINPFVKGPFDVISMTQV